MPRDVDSLGTLITDIRFESLRNKFFARIVWLKEKIEEDQRRRQAEEKKHEAEVDEVPSLLLEEKKNSRVALNDQPASHSTKESITNPKVLMEDEMRRRETMESEMLALTSQIKDLAVSFGQQLKSDQKVSRNSV
eukprot:TRINITY_DN1360_c0_g2_i2.p5 TRINITY_DN1360_c0_g2~~TRINITY_DN1360_c0_g2_i2.p5  ORF type:complete len:135 (-),score=22.87 TRINITY_DN1360_c0_g2_i2:908-1312(-)